MRLIDECDAKGVLIKVPDTMIEEWFKFGILRLIYCVNVDPNLSYNAVARLGEVVCNAHGSHN